MQLGAAHAPCPCGSDATALHWHDSMQAAVAAFALLLLPTLALHLWLPPMRLQVKHKGVDPTAALHKQYSYFLAPQASAAQRAPCWLLPCCCIAGTSLQQGPGHGALPCTCSSTANPLPLPAATQDVKEGDVLHSGAEAPIRPGNTLPLSAIPVRRCCCMCRLAGAAIACLPSAGSAGWWSAASAAGLPPMKQIGPAEAGMSACCGWHWHSPVLLCLHASPIAGGHVGAQC